MSASHGFSQVTVYHKKWNVSMRKMALVNLLILLCLLMVPRCAMGETVWFSCDFGSIKNETFCSMVQVLSNGLDWKLASTSDKADTGPNKDHTNNAAGIGRFLWADSDDGAPGEKASISTPPFNLTNGEGWLTFWYHLYGDGDLEIRVCQGGDPVLNLYGDQRNEWHEQNLRVSCGDNATQITFTSTLSSSRSDVAVDDIFLYENLHTTTIEPPSTSSSSRVPISSFIATSSGIAPSSPVVTSSQTTIQIPLSTAKKISESYRELAIGFGIVALLLLVFGVAVTFLYIRLRMTLSKNKTEQPEKPYMDLVPTGPSTTYETMVSETMSKIKNSSYENQVVVTQHQHIHPQSSVGDEYDYAL